MIRWIVCIAALAACKTDPKPESTPTPKPAPMATPSPSPATPKPSLPPAVTGEPQRLDPDKVASLTPIIPGATELSPLSFDDRGQAKQAWCIPGSSASDGAIAVGKALFKRGWSVDDARGDPTRSGLAASQGELHVIVRLGGTDASCQGGTVANATYRGETITVPPAEGGTVH